MRRGNLARFLRHQSCEARNCCGCGKPSSKLLGHILQRSDRTHRCDHSGLHLNRTGLNDGRPNTGHNHPREKHKKEDWPGNERAHTTRTGKPSYLAASAVALPATGKRQSKKNLSNVLRSSREAVLTAVIRSMAPAAKAPATHAHTSLSLAPNLKQIG